jgi:hypothetical protein
LAAIYACTLKSGETFEQSFTTDSMGLGTKNRQKQTADICKQHLREKYQDKLGLVEEFIVEVEGPLPDQREGTTLFGSPRIVKSFERFG